MNCPTEPAILKPMSYVCAHCGAELKLDSTSVVGRSETCDTCRGDLHACLNCRHHDPSMYNECRESQAERVLDKRRSNFCDYFSFYAGPRRNSAGQGGSALKALDDLFKK